MRDGCDMQPDRGHSLRRGGAAAALWFVLAPPAPPYFYPGCAYHIHGAYKWNMLNSDWAAGQFQVTCLRGCSIVEFPKSIDHVTQAMWAVHTLIFLVFWTICSSGDASVENAFWMTLLVWSVITFGQFTSALPHMTSILDAHSIFMGHMSGMY